MLESESDFFLGLSLGGGKTDKASLAVLECFKSPTSSQSRSEQMDPVRRPDKSTKSTPRVFLTKLIDKIKSDVEISADLKIHELIQPFANKCRSLNLDVALSLPLCLTCKLDCPGFETCNEAHIRWMWKNYLQHSKNKKPKRLFTPYTQRCSEMYVLHNLEEPFFVPHAMGANSAPLLARGMFIRNRMANQLINEVLISVSVWRIGLEIGVSRHHLKRYNSAVSGNESRHAFLAKLVQRTGIFFYEQDFRSLLQNSHAFDSFICAYLGYLKHLGATEPKPIDFPKNEDWPKFPKQDWFKYL